MKNRFMPNDEFRRTPATFSYSTAYLQKEGTSLARVALIDSPNQAMIETVIVLALLSALVATEPDDSRAPK